MRVGFEKYFYSGFGWPESYIGICENSREPLICRILVLQVADCIRLCFFKCLQAVKKGLMWKKLYQT